MADPGSRAAADEPRSPWLRPGFVLAAAFIGFLAVVAGAVVLTSDPAGQDDALPASRPPADRAVAPAESSPAGDDRCPELADKRRELLTAAPRG